MKQRVYGAGVRITYGNNKRRLMNRAFGRAVMDLGDVLGPYIHEARNRLRAAAEGGDHKTFDCILQKVIVNVESVNGNIPAAKESLLYFCPEFGENWDGATNLKGVLIQMKDLYFFRKISAAFGILPAGESKLNLSENAL